ncbi:hypothetical protein H6F67_19480 [Microcoleus sp. FACHB-1515]|uniref:hypothetical protein n=1 Tax=Cyanophyceae TaxID=3028117 RepID=UPI001685F6E2|nr:hypothetical protein [Microcoleus sp. FACHB-1515]MBD2092033.1 hypothetical protein [Microcoleus sp. FACHB-1515]
MGSPVQAIDHGAIVVMPGLYNCHMHMGDSCLPDGATGMTGTAQISGSRYHCTQHQRLSTVRCI